MNYNFNDIEKKWQDYWAKNQTFKASNTSDKPKYYILDMFPYPSGAGLHVGHPLGYIASDIYARYKRHKGFNVLHPQGYDSFGLPAEQYAIQTGQHPAITTETNIKTYRRQLDQIGFSFDWSREVRTSSPEYYKWTQWIFIQLFESWYNKETDQAEPISTLISKFSSEGNSTVNAACDEGIEAFTAEDWKSFSSEKQQEILLKYRLTYLAETEVNWCPALGTVLANDEIVNGVSERGGHPVVRKKMTQWSMRISAYAERLLQGLDTIDWTDSLKESQRNWIGKSVGAIVRFPILSFTKGEEKAGAKVPGYMTGGNHAHLLNQRAKELRSNPTEAEAVLWSQLRGKALGAKFRQQHLIEDFIADFVCLDKKLIIEVDGKIHESQIEKDTERSNILETLGYKVIRFKNEEVLGNIDTVLDQITKELAQRVSLKDIPQTESGNSEQVLPLGQDLGWEIDVFTTRPDTIFGVSFMTLAPEHGLVSQITTAAQKADVEAYIEKTAKRSERDRMADVKTISGVFTGAYAEHPFTKEAIPIWIGDYVLAGYGTGAVMSVPCGDQRDYDFAKYFDIPIPNIFSLLTPKGGTPTSENLIETEAFTEKSGFVIKNSDFLNGLNYKEASKKAILELEKIGQGEGKTNYRLRDAVFSRQRYWGEPFPVYYVNGMPQMIDAKHLPLTLPEVEKYLPTEEGEPPLGRATHWAWDTKNNTVVSNEMLNHPDASGQHDTNEGDAVTLSAVEGSNKGIYPLELNTMPGWAGSSWYFFRYMEPGLSAGRESMRNETFTSDAALNYWENVDLYIGGSEHATGHLLYARFWTKFLKDRGFVGVDEPFKKLINQGMILGTSAIAFNITNIVINHLSGPYKNENDKINFTQDGSRNGSGQKVNILVSKDLVYESSNTKSTMSSSNISVLNHDPLKQNKLFKSIIDYLDISEEIKDELTKGESILTYYVNPIRIDVNLVNSSDEIDLANFQSSKNSNDYKAALFITEEDDTFNVGREVEKMSKRWLNVVNPEEICTDYGADSLRLYEMFLGPLEQYKPWNTAGITGVHGFLKKLWKLYHQGENGSFYVSSESSSPLGKLEGAYPMGKPDGALKTLHKTIKKVEEDIENFSFNTSVSTFMIAVNELSAQKCTNKEILEPLLILISPYAPHIAEELWEKLGHETSITTAAFPKFEEKYLVESSKNYPISFNGKMRFTLELPLDISKEEIEKTVMAHEKTQAQLEGRTPKKVIVVPGKIVNIVG